MPELNVAPVGNVRYSGSTLMLALAELVEYAAEYPSASTVRSPQVTLRATQPCHLTTDVLNSMANPCERGTDAFRVGGIKWFCRQ